MSDNSTSTAALRPGSKQSLLARRLEGLGASLPELMKATGWQGHSVRAAMTGLRKRGLQIERLAGADGAQAVYRIKPAPASAPRRRRSK